jgi:protein sidekick
MPDDSVSLRHLGQVQIQHSSYDLLVTAPGAPSNVSFPDVSLTTARIIWDVPDEPNGEILAYRVTYHLRTHSDVNFSREFPPSDRTYR